MYPVWSSWSSGWHQTPCIAEHDLEFLTRPFVFASQCFQGIIGECLHAFSCVFNFLFFLLSAHVCARVCVCEHVHVHSCGASSCVYVCTEDWTQGLPHSKWASITEPYPKFLFTFYLRQGLTKLHRLALNLWFSCLSVLSVWNFRPVPPGPASSSASW